MSTTPRSSSSGPIASAHSGPTAHSGSTAHHDGGIAGIVLFFVVLLFLGSGDVPLAELPAEMVRVALAMAFGIAAGIVGMMAFWGGVILVGMGIIRGVRRVRAVWRRTRVA